MKYSLFFILLLSLLPLNSVVAQEQVQQNPQDASIDPPDVKEISAPKLNANDAVNKSSKILIVYSLFRINCRKNSNKQIIRVSYCTNSIVALVSFS